MAPIELIERLVSAGPRGPGSDGERRAAEQVARELERLDRDAEIEPARVRTPWHLTHALHAALAVVGSVVSVYAEPVGVVIVLLAAVSAYGDLSGRFHVLRRVFPKYRSQNVTSRGANGGAAARIVLTARIDASRSGLLYAQGRRPPAVVLSSLARFGGRIDLYFWAMIVVLGFAVARLFIDEEPTVFTALQFGATVVLITFAMLFADVALSGVVPGASGNASGVAAVLEVARRVADRPLEHADLWLAFPGSSTALMLGMREWMRAHDDEIDPRDTFFVNVESVGRGEVRFVPAEGHVVVEQHDARLVELARSIGGATPQVLRIGTDGVVPRVRGFAALTVCCTDRWGRIPDYRRRSDTPARVEASAVERATDFVEELVRRIDGELLPKSRPTIARASRT